MKFSFLNIWFYYNHYISLNNCIFRLSTTNYYLFFRTNDEIREAKSKERKMKKLYTIIKDKKSKVTRAAIKEELRKLGFLDPSSSSGSEDESHDEEIKESSSKRLHLNTINFKKFFQVDYVPFPINQRYIRPSK